MKRMVVLGLVVLTVGSSFAGAAKQPEKPNVLFIVADDLNVDLACYGHPVVKTPNIDKLRERGMVFERAYSQYPLCNPSRNSFMTGLYPGTSGCLDNGMNIREAVPDVVTLLQLFKNNGYRSITPAELFHQKDPLSWSRISNLRTGGLLPLDREPLNICWLSHEDLVQGGRLVLNLSPVPNKQWGVNDSINWMIRSKR